MDRETLELYERYDPEAARAVLLARLLADRAVRNSELENLHAGKAPEDGRGSTRKTTVVCGTKVLPWDQVSRISDKEMHRLMVGIEKQLVLLLGLISAWEKEGKMPEMLQHTKEEYFGPSGVTWNMPQEVYRERRRRWRELRRQGATRNREGQQEQVDTDEHTDKADSRGVRHLPVR